MAHPEASFQPLLLESADNGRVKVQHERATAQPATTNPGNQGSHRRNGDRTRPGRGFGPVARQSRPAGSTASPYSRPAPSLQPAVVVPPRWSGRKSATLILRPIPTDATPWDIRQYLEKFGRVVWVELDRPERGAARSVKVRFEPPPTDLSFFNQGRCRLNIGGFVSWPLIEFPRQQPDEPTLTTPLGNTCPPLMVLKPERLIFGLLTQPTTVMHKKEVISLSPDLELKLTVDFRRKKLAIHFPLLVDLERQYYRMDIKFGIIKAIHRFSSDQGGPGSALVIRVHDPPLFRKKEADVDGSAWADRLVWGEDELWNRAVEIKPSSQNPKAEPVSLDEEPNAIDLGRWTTYWIDLNKAGEEQWWAMEGHLQDWNITTNTDVVFTQVPDEKPKLWGLLADASPSMSTTRVGSFRDNGLSLLSPTTHVSLPYDVRYQLEVCLSHGILCEYNITREFLEKLREMSQPVGLDSNRARLILEYAADQGMPIYDPMDLFQDRAAMTYYPTTLHIPDYCALVRKITITPTRIYFSTPTVETNNRIIRHYKHVQGLFIRIQFTDELLDGRIRACEVDRDDDLYTRVYRVMMHGIRMGKWHWKFLAFGNSQIRESGAFFFCEPDDKSITCDSIRQWMGNFEHILSIAKYAARQGQCFSTTRLLPCISSPRIVKISDVEKGGFCFTDGVGKISGPLASLVSDDWKIYPPPSAFQFRMGGCKGVLVVWPDAKGTEVHVRPSQEKFSAEYNGLEIIRPSQFSCATLNRQIISVLSSLGVPDDAFIDMMAKQISGYDTAMTDKNKAVELLSTCIDENMTTATIATMVMNGFMDTHEPFVRTLLQLWRSWSIKALKEKARLIVDQGAFLLGCVDETGTLRGHSRATEGRKKIPQNQLPQIFLQVPDPKDRGAYKVITGLCLVGRNPSLHPGDIRVVEAVDVPQLRHLRDVVVFPLKGDQDVPSMCSGGDLDGDDFFVIWDPKLLPSEWSQPPMNYTAPKPLIEPRASTAKALASFFVLFMKNDRLPLIAHAHLATADYSVEGAKDEKCLKLAELHSTAVDYSKTGIPAVWDKKLDPRKYPHFMEKAKNKSYHSTKVLGKLYDMVNREVFDNKENYTLPFDDRILRRYQLENNLLKEARKIKSQYDIAMRRVMGQLEIRTEFEVWSGFVLSRPRVGSDYKVQEKVGREAAGLKKQFRDLCLKMVEKQSFDKMEFVAAMYKVTWEESRIALYEARQPHVLPDGTVGLRRITARSMPLISFPWLFPTELGRIALGAEQLPSFPELRQQTGTTKSEPRGGRSDIDLDLMGMDYTKTSDGQFIHRGEILHLFRHADDDDGEEGFYCGDDTVPAPAPDFPTPEREIEAETPAFPAILDLATPLDEISSTINATTPKTEETIDLLSSDADSRCDFSPCLIPTQVTTLQHNRHGITTTKMVNGVGLVSKAPHSPEGEEEEDIYSPPSSSPVATAAATMTPPTPIPTAPELPAATGTSSVISLSDSHSSSSSNWDRVTSPSLDNNSNNNETEELDLVSAPVEYIPIARVGAGRGFSYSPYSSAGRLYRESGGGGGDIWANFAAGGGRGGGVAGLKGEDKKEVGGSMEEEEVEYEEAVVEEVEGETALERAARFG